MNTGHLMIVFKIECEAKQGIAILFWERERKDCCKSQSMRINEYSPLYRSSSCSRTSRRLRSKLLVMGTRADFHSGTVDEILRYLLAQERTRIEGKEQLLRIAVHESKFT